MTLDTINAADLRKARRGLGVNQRIQCVATGGQLPINVTPSTGATGFTRSEGQFKFQLGPKRVRGLRYAFASFYNTTGGELEGIDFTLLASLLQGGNARWLGIGNNKQPAINGGAGLIITDPFLGDLDAGSIWQGRAGAVFTANAQVPGGRQKKWGASDENYFDSAAGATRVFDTSSFSLPSGGANSAYGFGPAMFLGIPEMPHPAVALYGDSIAYGQNVSSDGTGNKGIFERGMANVFGSIPMPYTNFSRSGDVLTSNGMTGNRPYYPQKPRIRGYFEYHTDILICIGTNDLGSNSNIPIEKMFETLVSLVKAGREAGCRVHVSLILPHTTDAGNTAIYVPSGDVTAFMPGGKRFLFNNAVRNMYAAGEIDGVVDLCAVLEDPLNPGFWVAPNLTDSIGLHPNDAASAIAEPVVRAWAQSLQYLQ